MKPFNLTVLLFCLVTYGYGRPSTNEESDEISRDAKKDKYFQHDNVGELPERQTESSTAENVLDRLKSLARLRMADTQRPSAATDTFSREELEALRELLDRNLRKYQNYDAYSANGRKRPANDPYTGQIVQKPQNTGHQSVTGNRQDGHDHSNNNENGDDEMKRVESQQMPIRRKIIRRTVFAMPLGRSGVGNDMNRLYGGDADDLGRINWSSPWADYFPILIKDPLQTMMNSFSEIIEYGPAADICKRAEPTGGSGRGARTSRSAVRPATLKRSRRNTGSAAVEEKGVLNHVRPYKPHGHHTSTTTEAPKLYHWTTDRQAAEHNGDMGPQIKRLVVRRGGVAIAGPGGIATAGSGGTAIVGPGGSAYSSKDTASGATADAQQPSGISMAGHGPQMVQAPLGYYAPYPQQQQQYNGGFGRSVDGGGTAVLSADGATYTFPAASRGLTAAGRWTGGDGDARPYAASTAREIVLPDGAKLIATGPIVYYNPEPLSRKKSRKGKKGGAKSRRDQ
ncbi:uncharacterized protein LOC112687608 isoform X2 [Sipha flava]|uniref:Uncharacterized protein LOC112687608 isoform X2 n=1 Tax=Sipha flava TaxID=143950 RepID=A0A8B8FZH9_9HEMI|nr:uncharacterized protein LOC112687608 isoform X2 [Sipha flava]